MSEALGRDERRVDRLREVGDVAVRRLTVAAVGDDQGGHGLQLRRLEACVELRDRDPDPVVDRPLERATGALAEPESGLEAVETSAGWPCRSGKVVLDIALTTLARHYGLIPPERPLATHLRHWGDADYRPTLDAWRPNIPHDTPADTPQPAVLPNPAKSV